MRKLEIFTLCSRLAAVGIPFVFRRLENNYVCLYMTHDCEVLGYYAQSECDSASFNYGQLTGRWYINCLDYEFESVPGDPETAYQLFYDSFRYDTSGHLSVTCDNDRGMVSAGIEGHVRFEISRRLHRRNPRFWADVANGYYRTEEAYDYLNSVHVSLICSCCRPPEYVDFFDYG